MTTSQRRLDLLLLLGLCFLCFFWRLGSAGLFDFNEGLYTEIAREMYLRGDYLAPRSNGLYWFDKPPLALWEAALSFRLFGVNEFAARFPVAVAATLLVLLTWWFGARYFGRRAGLLAGAMLALNPLFLGTARQMTMDIHQSLWFAVAMVCFFLGYTTDRETAGQGAVQSKIQNRKSNIWYYGFWAGCGLAFMAKGAPGLMPIFVALVFVIVHERFRLRPILARIWEANLLPGIALMLAVILPWHYLMYRAAGPVFLQEYFWHHHVQILNGKDFNHAQPFWYYVPALLAGFFPWSIFLPWALKTEGAAATARRFVLIWAVVLFLLFSLVVSKVVSYLLPMYAAAALLVGDWMARALAARQEKGLRRGSAAVALLAMAGLVFAVVKLRQIAGSRLATDLHQAVPPAVIAYALHGLILVAAGSALAAVLIWRRRTQQGVLALVGTLAAFTVLSVSEGLAAMQTTMNAPLQSLAREAGARLAGGAPLAIHIAGPVRPSVFFYLPASVFLSKPLPGPKGSGLILDSGDRGPIEEFLACHRPAYVLTDRKRADVLLAADPGLVIADQHDRWVLLRAGPLHPPASRLRAEAAPRPKL
jgi:4-amino-4-deoxy-L-arabinose transferase-like glycosyltransferase